MACYTPYTVIFYLLHCLNAPLNSTGKVSCGVLRSLQGPYLVSARHSEGPPFRGAAIPKGRHSEKSAILNAVIQGRCWG